MKLLLCLTSLFTVLSNKLINIVNKERIQYSLLPITYNYTLENEINIFRKNYNDSWFYESSNKNYTVYLKDNDKLIPRNQHLRGVLETPFNYFFRDTYKKSIPLIFQFRANQRDCFDFNKCSKTKYYFFTSCVKKLEIHTRKKCSFAYAYYPFMILPSLKSIACITTNIQGRYVPESLKNTQKKSFWCYGHFDKPLVDNVF